MAKQKVKDRGPATALAEALDNLPLALEQAAAYAAQCKLSLTDYLSLFRERQPEVAERASGSEEYPLALATTRKIRRARGAIFSGSLESFSTERRRCWMKTST